jgi:hypothetical protein
LCIPLKIIPALNPFPTMFIMQFEGFPYVQKPPVIADQSGYICTQIPASWAVVSSSQF